MHVAQPISLVVLGQGQTVQTTSILEPDHDRQKPGNRYAATASDVSSLVRAMRRP